MARLQILLGVMVAGMLAYTGAVILREGIDFIAPFVAAILSLTWVGQFTFDFACYLILSALWVMWRHAFSATGVALGAACGLFGFAVFAPYLLVISLRTQTLRALVLGGQRT